MLLEKRKSYLQIAFNRSLDEVRRMVSFLPKSERILVEAGTPFVKQYGQEGITNLKTWWQGYVVADLKCMDRGSTEVEMVKKGGASAATCLGLSPIPTIDAFIDECRKYQVDSMVDMMNVQFPFEILQRLKKMPDIVVLHRGVDEGERGAKEIPYYDINRIIGTYNVMVSVAGGESFKEVKRAIFNDASISVVWRAFYEEPEKTAGLVREFLKEIK